MKIAAHLLSYLFCLSLHAQIPNWNFENWNSRNSLSIDDWNTIGNVSRSTDATSGSYSIRLDNKLSDSSFGVVSNANLGPTITGGQAYTDNPLVMSFSTKYSFAPGDVGKIIALFMAGGNAIAAVDFELQGNSADTFVRYKVPIQWVISTKPDTLVLAFSTIDFNSPSVNGDGYMIVDQLVFETFGVEDDSVTNADFETWSNNPLLYPEGWYTTDLYLQDYEGIMFHEPLVSQESVNPHDGNYSILLQNRKINGSIYPGVALTGNDISTFENPAFPINVRHSYIHGLYKFLPDGGDSASLTVYMFNKGMVMGHGIIHFTDSTATDHYSYFAFPINYAPGATAPDSAGIIISAANPDNARGASTRLWIDNLEFVERTLAIHAEELDIGLSPNPALHSIHINGINANAEIILFNSTGQELMRTSDTEIDLRSFEAGIYFILVKQENRIFGKTKFIKL